VDNLPLQITKSQMDQATNTTQALVPVTETVLLTITPTEVTSQQIASLKVEIKELNLQKVEPL